MAVADINEGSLYGTWKSNKSAKAIGKLKLVTQLTHKGSSAFAKTIAAQQAGAAAPQPAPQPAMGMAAMAAMAAKASAPAEDSKI